MTREKQKSLSIRTTERRINILKELAKLEETTVTNLVERWIDETLTRRVKRAKQAKEDK